uniref:Asl1-like glycosyl hydrolase catalytic domain-containing protein n=1 Tax=Desulfovibrio sp. U5L TaxID=596152 RepID=I2Q5C3_9BACT
MPFFLAFCASLPAQPAFAQPDGWDPAAAPPLAQEPAGPIAQAPPGFGPPANGPYGPGPALGRGPGQGPGPGGLDLSGPPLPPDRAAVDDSPFGLYGPLIESESLGGASGAAAAMRDLGAGWARIISPALGRGGKALRDQGVRLYVALGPEPDDTVRSLVSRNKEAVRVWRIGNEPDFLRLGDRPDLYLADLKRLYPLVKSVDPTAVVTFGALSNEPRPGPDKPGYRYLETLLKGGACRYFDVFTFHAEGEEADWQGLGRAMAAYGDLLSRYQCQKPVWVTEMGTYSGQPSGRRTFAAQTEAGQAAGLVKRYVAGLALGIKKMFWTTLVEYHDFAGQPGSYYNFTGLVHNPKNKGLSSKKLAYYAYRQLSQKVLATDWQAARTVSDGADGLYVTEFPARPGGTPLWVAWREGSAEARDARLAVGPASRVRVTPAVPRPATGREADKGPAFDRATARVTGGVATVRVGDAPVYVEPVRP